jgi:hypothetical protein
MALTAQEQAEMAQLEQEMATSAPAPMKKGALSASEAAELAQLENELQFQGDAVVNEMHPDISSSTRAIYKNFAADPVASFNFLQKRNPELQWKKDKEGEILAKRADEKAWKRLDPTGFDVQDISDIAFDIPAGFLQGAATAGAGIAGGVAGGGIGAIPAAMAAGAGSGVALEGARQGLGAMFGIEDNFSKDDALLAGATGVVSPLMFGTGASAKQAIKAAGKTGLQDLMSSQRGLIGRAYDKVAGTAGKKIASAVGGYKEETLAAAAENLPLIQAAQKDPAVAVQALTDGKQKILSGVQGALTETGKKLETLTAGLDEAGEVIPTARILEPLEKLKEKLKTSGLQSDERKALVERLEAMVQENFAVGGKIPENVSATTANEMYFTLKGLASDSGVDLSKTGTLKGAIKPGAMNDMRVARALNEATKNAKKEIAEAAKVAGLGDDYTKLNAEYSELKGFQDLFNKATKDEEAYQRFLNKRGSQAEFAKQKVSEMVGEDVNKLGAKMQAIDTFANPSWEIPALGNSNTGRTLLSSGLGGAAAGIGANYSGASPEAATAMGVAGSLLGSRAMSPVMIRKYLEMNQGLRALPGKTPGYQAMPYLLLNEAREDR